MRINALKVVLLMRRTKSKIPITGWFSLSPTEEGILELLP
jgi:hypothetical protein